MLCGMESAWLGYKSRLSRRHVARVSDGEKLLAPLVGPIQLLWKLFSLIEVLKSWILPGRADAELDMLHLHQIGGHCCVEVREGKDRFTRSSVLRIHPSQFVTPFCYAFPPLLLPYAHTS